jgi:NitT/TauT family transport system substrate-binding protein
MSKLFKICIIIGIVLLCVGLFGLFQKNSSLSVVKKTTLPVVRIAASAPAVPHLISQVIINQGFDKEFGFTLEIKPIDPTQTVSALVSNAVDVAVIGVIPAAKINEEGQKIQLIGPALKLTCPFVVPAESQATTWQDLKGKKLGTPIKSGATYLALQVIMKSLGVDIDTYFQVVEGQFYALPSLLANGSVDAFTGVCDEISNGKWMAQAKTKPLSTMEDLTKQTYGEQSGLILSAFGVTKQWLDAHPKEARAVMQAVEKARLYIAAHPEVYDSTPIKSAYQLKDAEIPYIKNFITTYHNYEFADWKQTIIGEKKFLQNAKTMGILKEDPQKDFFIAF